MAIPLQQSPHQLGNTVGTHIQQLYGTVMRAVRACSLNQNVGLLVSCHMMSVVNGARPVLLLEQC